MRVKPFDRSTLLLLASLALALPAEAVVFADSDFEYDSGFGLWTNPPGDDFDWTRNEGGTPSGGTGPSGDHTSGSGYYLYTEASGQNNLDEAILDGPCIDLTARSSAGWSFWYHMSGSSMGALYAETADSCDDNPTTWTPVLTISGNQGSSWQQANIDLGSRIGTKFRVRFRGERGNGSSSDIAIDDVLIDATGGLALPLPPAHPLVDAMDIEIFKDHVAFLSSSDPPINGSRHWSQPGNAAALDYIQAELESYGYTVERHTYPFEGEMLDNVYATKVGEVHPDQMFMISAHMDSFNTQSSGSVFAPGANDDGSGTALVLEAARVFGDPSVTTDYSVRFILWNNEETGLDGSAEYVSDRAGLQGIEDPPSSGLYPEPTWLLIVQHDMMMWDHGIPPGPNQIMEADVDVEYQASAVYADESKIFANRLQTSNVYYGPAYPAEVSDNMNHTDSKSFQNFCPAVSARENRRVAEIGNGSNPNWHKNSDVYSTYSEADFLLGFTAGQTTVGAIAELAGARVAMAVPLRSPAIGAILGLLLLAPAVAALARARR